MLNKTYTLYGPYNTKLWTSSGSSSSTSGDATRLSDTFTYSGFGPRDPRRRRLPNAGTYEKTYLTRVSGIDSSHSYRKVNGDWEWSRITTGWLGSYNHWFGDVATFDIPVSLVYNECLSKFNDSVRDSELNLALTIGEARETYRMLRGIVGVISEARKVRRLAVRNPSLLISKLWLSYKYGWQPFLSDIYNYMRFCASKLDTIDVKARRRMASPKSNISNATTTVSFSGQKFVQVEIGARLSVADRTAFDASRLTSFDPLSIAWELTPLSFVADWFIDVGGYLQNMEASFNHGLKFDHGYVTRLWFADQKASISYRYTFEDSLSRRFDSMSGTSACRYAKKERIILSSYPKPSLPTFSIKLGAQRLMSAAALIRTILLGRVR